MIIFQTMSNNESCSRTSRVNIIPRLSSQKFILPKENSPNIDLLSEVSQQGGYVISLNSEDILTTHSSTCSDSGESATRSLNNNTLCCICSAKITEKSVNVFEDFTSEGNNFSDVLSSVVGSDVWEPQHVTSVLCVSCADLVSRIDHHRVQLDRDCSHLRDLVQASQQSVENDLFEPESRPCDVISSLISGETLECRILDISQGVVAGHFKSADLCCPVLDTQIIRPRSGDVEEVSRVRLYCSPLEWAEYQCSGEIKTLCSGCILAPDQSHSSITVLSQKILDCVLVELEQEQRFPYLCSDCDKCYDKLHLLISHLHDQHMETSSESSDTGEDSADDEAEQNVIIIAEKTGEKPSVEKPFQCETCEKCFSNYSNLMSHVEHYHGWSRQCNVTGCEVTCSSIAEFVTHHVRHRDPGFFIPDTNHERNSVYCRCPVCPKTSAGVNRHWEHSFTHDPVPRFKCPLCDRRVNKVQNLKDHIKRHLGAESKTKECEVCHKMFCPADIYKHMKTVHGKQENKFTCNQCGKSFPQLHKLKFHSSIHNN